MFVPNAEIIVRLPISFSLLAPAAGAGESVIEISSATPVPLKDGQKFKLSNGTLDGDFTIAGDQELIEGANLLTVAPNLVALPIGADTDRATDRRGNSIDQSVPLKIVCSLAVRFEKMLSSNNNSVASEQELYEVRGRVISPFRLTSNYDLTNATIKSWRSPNSYVEGIFKFSATSLSRIGADDFFGEKIRGMMFLDHPNRVLEGVIDAKFCC
jgi:hypothetical protein